MMKNMKRGLPSLFKAGTEHLTGLEEAVMKNLKACQQLADLTKTSFGPNGMNKMIINYMDRLFVTNDTTTIIKETEVQHPAARMVVLAATMQETEIGDGSNLVVCLAGELLAKAEELILMGLHPSEIIAGFEAAGVKVQELIDDLVCVSHEGKELGKREVLNKVIYSAISAKQRGREDILVPLVAQACETTMPSNTYNFNVDNIRVAKLMGGSLDQSYIVRGMVFPGDPYGSTKIVQDAKIAIFTCSIAAAETETKGTVLIKSAEELLNYNDSEERHLEGMIKGIAQSGVKVIVSGSTVDDMAKHFLEKYGIMTIKMHSKHNLRRLCKAVKARPLVALQDHVSAEDQGYCSEVRVEEVGLKKITIFRQDSNDSTGIATVVLRGSTSNFLNDVEKAVDDAVNVTKACGRDGRFVPGAGATEIELSRLLSEYGATQTGLDQYAINKYAEALECIPRTLAENSGLDAVDTVANLLAAHADGDVNSGIDLDNGDIKDMTTDGIIDLLATKKQALQLATDAAITVLRVDQIIKAKRAGGPKSKKQTGHWDDE